MTECDHRGGIWVKRDDRRPESTTLAYYCYVCGERWDTSSDPGLARMPATIRTYIHEQAERSLQARAAERAKQQPPSHEQQTHSEALWVSTWIQRRLAPLEAQLSHLSAVLVGEQRANTRLQDQYVDVLLQVDALRRLKPVQYTEVTK